MDRRAFIAGTVSFLAAPLVAEAQQPGKVYRIGYLGSRNPEAAPRPVQAFRQGLRELGWVEGQNLAIEYRFAGTKLERFPDLAAELVRLNVDVIFSATETGARAAKQATATIPIVVGAFGDPVGTGLVASLAHPGGNVTGFAFLPGPEISGKLLQLLKEVVPKVSRVAVLWNPSNPVVPPHWSEAQAAAQALRVTLLSVEARAPQDVERAFSAMTSWRAGALLVLPDIFTITHQNQIGDLAAKSRLPAMYGFRDSVEAGASSLMRRAFPICFDAPPSTWTRS